MAFLFPELPKKTSEKKMWTRLMSMYTHINLVFVMLFCWLPIGVKDIVRASTFLILVVVSTIWASGDLCATYSEFVDSFEVGESHVPVMLAAAADLLIHVVPLCLIGLPRAKFSLLIAFLIMSTWYSRTRHRIREIYVPSIQGLKADRGIFIAGLVTFANIL